MGTTVLVPTTEENMGQGIADGDEAAAACPGRPDGTIATFVEPSAAGDDKGRQNVRPLLDQSRLQNPILPILAALRTST